MGSVFGQIDNYRFKHLTLEDGLSQSSIFSIIQDNDGFMWFGTVDGLHKYDGYTIQTFQYDPNDPNTIGNNTITSLYKNRTGQILIGTYNGAYKHNKSSRDR